jgi:hypothetical protein
LNFFSKNMYYEKVAQNGSWLKCKSWKQ